MNEPKPSPEGTKTQASVLIELGRGAELFEAPDGERFATYKVNDHMETHPVAGKQFREWLVHRFFKSQGKPPQEAAVKTAIQFFMARARYEGSTTPVYVRVANLGDRIFLDLGNDKWEAVVVTASGWSIVSSPPVKFRRPVGMAALPMPEGGGSIDDLRPFVNVNGEDFPLVVGFLVGSLRGKGPFAILELLGDQGSAKSTTSRVIKGLLDPNISPVRAMPKDERDLAISGTNSWCPVFDNISKIPEWLSDALCRMSTGGGFSTRVLYSDAEEKIFDLMRPVILNGIGDVVVRGDLLDRTLVLRLPTIKARRIEDDFYRDLAQVRGRILGVLLDAVVAALRNESRVPAVGLPRLADLARWIAASEEAFGWDGRRFLDAYSRNRREATAIALEGDSVATVVISVARQGDWSGTASDLLSVAEVYTVVGLPRTPQHLSESLRRLVPYLREIGIDVTFRREGHESIRKIYIRSSK
jgi:hypothetical protein